MSQGDEDSVEESKVPDPSMVDASDSGRNDPHGDASRGDITQAVTQTQHGDDDIQDWDAKALSHVLVHVLDKDQVEASATNDLTVFVITNGIDDVRVLLTVLEDDFKLMGYNINFKSFRTLQTLNKMYNEQILDAMSEDNKNMWFLRLGKRTVMRHMMCDAKVTIILSANIVATPISPWDDRTRIW